MRLSLLKSSNETSDDLASLFRSHREPMARLAYVLTSDAQISDEIVQDAFLQMRFYSDLPDEEVAAALGIRPATVRTRIHRGLVALRKVMP